MAAITDIRLTDALILVGPAFTQLQGFGDDMFSCAPVGDRGSMTHGVQGDTMFVSRVMSAWVLTITTLVASTAATTLLDLADTLGTFPISVSYGDWSLVGIAQVQNEGNVEASLGNTTRTITVGIAKQSGNTNATPGRVLAVV